MIIETERLILRPFTWDDLPEQRRLRSDPDVVRYLGGIEMQTPEFVEKRFRFYMDCRERYGFSMSPAVRKADGVAVGWGGLLPPRHTRGIKINSGFYKP